MYIKNIIDATSFDEYFCFMWLLEEINFPLPTGLVQLLGC